MKYHFEKISVEIFLIVFLLLFPPPLATYDFNYKNV